jgi:succinate dehydrogenase / fumarate reductase cytochrome b subunit
MAGNLQLFLGAEALNGYAMQLHGPLHELVLLARVVLAVALILHVAMALQLSARSSAARVIGYQRKKNDKTTFAALTMKYSGFTLLFFVFYHLAHFTYPGIAMGAYEHQSYTHVYSNVVNGFSIPWVVALYVAAMISLGLHLYHGATSLLQTLGFNNPLRNDGARTTARFLAIAVTVGNILLPVSVLFGLVR